MWIFYFVGLLCLVAVPLVASFIAGQFLFGSMWWGRHLFTRRRDALQIAGPSGALLPAKTDDKGLLDRVLVSRRGAFGEDRTTVVDGIPIAVRAQPRIVDEHGERVGFPWTREDRATARAVMHIALVADLSDVLPESVSLHADARADEVGFGDDVLFAAFMTGRLRAAVAESDRIGFLDGCVVVDSAFAADDARVQTLLAALGHACRRLHDATKDGHIDVGSMLVEHLATDDDVTVRARAIDRLLTRYREDGETRRLGLELAVEDGAAEVRLAAARHLGEDGFDIAVATLKDGEASSALRQRALRFLMRRFDYDRLRPLFEEVLEDEDDRLALIVVRRLGDLEDRSSVPKLCAITAQAKPDLAAGVAQALGAIGDPSAELTLIALFKRREVEVRIAAADALATLGSADAVAHLLPVAESTRTAHALRVAASSAVQLIQSRLSGQAGALSVLTPPDSGQLSLDPAGRGALSDSPADNPDPIELIE
ncbi:MAG: HEAT repeat domain-containing protein [Deltaproteobacteria bacterium]